MDESIRNWQEGLNSSIIDVGTMCVDVSNELINVKNELSRCKGNLKNCENNTNNKETVGLLLIAATLTLVGLAYVYNIIEVNRKGENIYYVEILNWAIFTLLVIILIIILINLIKLLMKYKF